MWSVLEPLLGPIVNRVLDFIPNPEEKAKATLALQAQLQTAVLAAEQSQLDIDKVEAASPSLFVSGWRPGVAWVCTFGFAWQFVLLPFISYGMNVYCTVYSAKIPPLPNIDTQTLMTMLFALLGLGGMRTVEKVNGVSRDNMVGASK